MNNEQYQEVKAYTLVCLGKSSIPVQDWDDIIQGVCTKVWQYYDPSRSEYKQFYVGIIRQEIYSYLHPDSKRELAMKYAVSDEILKDHEIEVDYEHEIFMEEILKHASKETNMWHYGLTYAQIGEQLGITHEGVRQRIKKDLVVLRGMC